MKQSLIAAPAVVAAVGIVARYGRPPQRPVVGFKEKVGGLCPFSFLSVFVCVSCRDDKEVKLSGDSEISDLF